MTYYLTHWDGNKLHQNSSSLQLTANACVFHSQSKYLYHTHPYINWFTMKLNAYQNMIYVKLRTLNFPATVTNKRRHFSKGLVDDYIKTHERG